MFKGTHYEVGVQIGQSMGARLQSNINLYIGTVDQHYGLDYQGLDQSCMEWFNTLPECYQTELTGIADGSNCTIEEIVKWYYCDYCLAGGCTSFITQINDELWIGRNNDYIESELWGHVTKLAIDGKIPVMLFGLEGSSFSGTGYNQEKVWIHYNYLPVWNTPGAQEEVIPAFVFLRMALETCASIEEVEILLKETIRDSGMNLFIVDGKTNQFAVYECTCEAYLKRDVSSHYVAGANHYNSFNVPKEMEQSFENSIKRQSRMEVLLNETIDTVQDIKSILSDPMIEQIGETSGTVYANIVCPARDEIYYASGRPSEDKWQTVNWK